MGAHAPDYHCPIGVRRDYGNDTLNVINELAGHYYYPNTYFFFCILPPANDSFAVRLRRFPSSSFLHNQLIPLSLDV